MDSNSHSIPEPICEQCGPNVGRTCRGEVLPRPDPGFGRLQCRQLDHPRPMPVCLRRLKLEPFEPHQAVLPGNAFHQVDVLLVASLLGKSMLQPRGRYRVNIRTTSSSIDFQLRNGVRVCSVEKPGGAGCAPMSIRSVQAVARDDIRNGRRVRTEEPSRPGSTPRTFQGRKLDQPKALPIALWPDQTKALQSRHVVLTGNRQHQFDMGFFKLRSLPVAQLMPRRQPATLEENDNGSRSGTSHTPCS
ncbi:MAG: hypothetical protein Ct9H300mP1_25470 [Planctomycetaceae bacterium]|nr:MAG: hypothetical protein Ct9H300mP1_25470 [Planctomycetaceae bacterium]